MDSRTVTLSVGEAELVEMLLPLGTLAKVSQQLTHSTRGSQAAPERAPQVAA